MIQYIRLIFYGSFVFVLVLSMQRLAAQTGQLEGKVIDQSSKGLEGATILVKGTTVTTLTDAAGNFRMPAPQPGSVLVISSVGYESQELTYEGQRVLTVTLQADNTALDEVVVVGYGTQRKSDLTGSVASVRSEDLEKQGPRINFVQSLQGAAPGLNITQSGNSASSGSISIDIRGQNSISASNDPLVILDGVPYTGGLNYIDQSTIASVEILKDASSAAIYGARGANGVIIITTKKGMTGKPTIAYEGSYGWKQAYGIPRLLTGPEHWAFGVERYGEGPLLADSTRTTNYENGLSTDWVKEATQIGRQQKHAVTLSGGTDKFNYLFAGNFSGVGGIAKGDDYQQVTGRANLTVKPTEWLEIGTNSQYTFMDNSGIEVAFSGGGSAPHDAGGLGGAFFMNPLVSPYDKDGNLAIIPWKERPTYPNPLATRNAQDEDYNRRLFSNNFLVVKLPLEGLSYKLNTGYSFRSANRDIFWGSNTIEGIQNTGQAYSSDTKETDWLIENLLFYNRTFGAHRLDVTLLYSSQENRDNTATLYARGFPIEDLTWYQPGSAEFITPGRSFLQESYLSQMARVFYSFNDKYLVTATVRRDGFSAFGSAKKFGVFPSIALGWNIHREGFMQDVNWIDQLKLRATYGENGNQAISAYSTLAKMSRSDYLTGPGGDQQGVGYLPGTMENELLGWESTRSLNVGLDYALVGGRLSGALDFYQSNTRDLLLNRAISSVNGVTNILSNIGKVQNTGIELSLTSRNITHEHFEWMTSLNVSHNKNKILDLYGDGEDDVANSWFIGRPISTNFGYLYEGVWQLNDDIPNSHQPTAKAGDVKIMDATGDGQITPDDRTFIGQRAPKVTFGITNQVTYKQFSLNITVTGRTGITRINEFWDTDIVYADAIRNTLKQNWWSPDNPTNDYPANRDGANPFGVRFYKNASFIRINQIGGTYELPAKALDRLKVSRCQISVGLINGFTFTPWNGLDPEYSSQRATPMDRIYNIGLNLTF